MPGQKKTNHDMTKDKCHSPDGGKSFFLKKQMEYGVCGDLILIWVNSIFYLLQGDYKVKSWLIRPLSPPTSDPESLNLVRGLSAVEPLPQKKGLSKGLINNHYKPFFRSPAGFGWIRLRDPVQFSGRRAIRLIRVYSHTLTTMVA